jgi:hypothetical protein
VPAIAEISVEPIAGVFNSMVTSFV